MTLQHDVEALRQIPLFAKFEPSKLKLLAFTSERLSFNADQELFRQGDPGDSLYIILDGEAAVLVDTPSGPITVAKVGKNDFFGDIAILCDVPRTATVKATKALTTLRISKDLFFQLVTQFPQISVEIMRELAHRLDRTTRDYREAVAKLKAMGGSLN
ncbi:MAG: cyclic nucleotide-binding domain-containing protein [Alphaproteobacteria bacterium]|nr:cyclic nucleotide-binding domain-containing protein [Alphaproteobacteria bacterium]